MTGMSRARRMYQRGGHQTAGPGDGDGLHDVAEPVLLCTQEGYQGGHRLAVVRQLQPPAILFSLIA